jgi:hypothetical protein
VHALGRDVFVVVQAGTQLPSDLKGSLYLEYDSADLRKFERNLQAQLESWRDHENVRVKGVEQLY